MKKNIFLPLLSFLVFMSWNAFSQQELNKQIKPPVTVTVTATHDSICPGDTVMMHVTKLNGATYLWLPGNQTTDTIYATPVVTTIYTVIVTQGANHYADTITITVIPLEHPVIKGTDSVCKGHRDTLFASGGFSYLWSNGSTKTNYITGSIESDSTIYITCYNQLWCAVRDSFKIYPKTNCPTGIEEIQNSNWFKVFPNPNNGVFSITSSNSEAIAGSQTIEIYNVLGQKVYSHSPYGETPFKINLSAQPSGLYFYRVLKYDDSLLGEGKVMVQK